MGDGTVGVGNAGAYHQVARGAVSEPQRAAGVRRDQAADGGAGRGRGVEAEKLALLGQLFLEVRKRHPRFDGDG